MPERLCFFLETQLVVASSCPAQLGDYCLESAKSLPRYQKETPGITQVPVVFVSPILTLYCVTLGTFYASPATWALGAVLLSRASRSAGTSPAASGIGGRYSSPPHQRA